MKIHCPNCQQEYDISESYINRKAECEKCNQKFIIQPEGPDNKLINLFFNEIYYRLNDFLKSTLNNPDKCTIQQARSWIEEFAKYHNHPFINNVVFNDVFIEKFNFIYSRILSHKNYKQEHTMQYIQNSIFKYYLLKSDRCKIESHKKYNNCCFYYLSDVAEILYPPISLNCSCYLEKKTSREIQKYNELENIPGDLLIETTNIENFNLKDEIIKNFDFFDSIDIKITRDYKSTSQKEFLKNRLEFWEKELSKAKNQKTKNSCKETIIDIKKNIQQLS